MLSNRIEYISLRFLLVKNEVKSKLPSLNQNEIKPIKKVIDDTNIEDADLIVIDIKGVRIKTSIPVDSQSNDYKKSAFYHCFIDAFKKYNNKFFLITNCEDYLFRYFIEKDFSNSELDNVYCISFDNDQAIVNFGTRNQSDLEEALISKIRLEKSFSFTKKEDIGDFYELLISNKIRRLLFSKKEECIEDTNLDNHILSSTPVHVNKYINIKPIIEDFESFVQLCFHLSEKILEKMGNPDFLITPSNNAISLASGLVKYLKSEILIINQVSPITSFNNFSTLRKINAKARFAIIEDFYCMGTEIKIIKGILWSHGVNVVDNVYSFPIASTLVIDVDSSSYTKEKVHPLLKIDEEFNYNIFTHYSCPVCNELKCDHRKLFRQI